MKYATCTADLDHPCDGGEDGEPCSSCVKWSDEAHAYFRREWEVASPADRDPEGYRRDMIDAGRGRLL